MSKIRRFVPLTLDMLNPKSITFDTVYRTTTVPNFKPFLSGIFVLSCCHTQTPTRPTTYPHAHTHHDKVIAISAPSHRVVGADNTLQSRNCTCTVRSAAGHAIPTQGSSGPHTHTMQYCALWHPTATCNGCDGLTLQVRDYMYSQWPRPALDLDGASMRFVHAEHSYRCSQLSVGSNPIISFTVIVAQRRMQRVLTTINNAQYVA